MSLIERVDESASGSSCAFLANDKDKGCSKEKIDGSKDKVSNDSKDKVSNDSKEKVSNGCVFCGRAMFFYFCDVCTCILELPQGCELDAWGCFKGQLCLEAVCCSFGFNVFLFCASDHSRPSIVSCLGVIVRSCSHRANE